jgi:DNA-binding Lrp family transcriptional regulator
MEKSKDYQDKRPSTDGHEAATAEQTSAGSFDIRVLRACLTDGRASFRKIASGLHVSTTTIASHISKLEAGRIIKGYAAIVDFQKLGYELTVVTELLVSKGKLLEMEREIAKLPGVCAVYDVTGEIDAIVVAKFKGREELSHFTKGLLALPFVERTNSHVVLTTVKEDFRLAI